MISCKVPRRGFYILVTCCYNRIRPKKFIRHMQKTFKTLEIIKDILPFLWTKQEKIRSLFIISFGLVFLSIALDLSIPMVLKEVVSSLASPDKSMTHQLSLLLVAYGVIWTLSQTIQQIRQIIMV